MKKEGKEMILEGKKITGKIVVTNNMTACDKYSGAAEICLMENAGPYEIFEKAMELIQGGARLVSPEIKSPASYYRTLGLFYGDDEAPIKRNVDELNKAMEAVKTAKPAKPAFDNMARLADLKRCKMLTK